VFGSLWGKTPTFCGLLGNPRLKAGTDSETQTQRDGIKMGFLEGTKLKNVFESLRLKIPIRNF